MNCQETQSRFDERLDEQLHDSERAAFDLHLTGCADCRQAYQQYAGAWTLLARHEAQEPSWGFVERTMRRLDEPAPASVSWWAWRPAWQWAALTALIIGLVAGGSVIHQRYIVAKHVQVYATVSQNDYLDDYDVIAHLDELEGVNNL